MKPVDVDFCYVPPIHIRTCRLDFCRMATFLKYELVSTSSGRNVRERSIVHLSILKTIRSSRESDVKEHEGVNVAAESKLSECVVTGLSRFGESVLKVVFYNLGMKPQETPFRPEELEKTLDKIFHSGSNVLKKSIVESIKDSFAIRSDCDSLKDCFEAARSRGHNR